MQDDESRKWLYTTLQKEGYNVGQTYDDFAKLMDNNEESRRWCYDRAQELGYNVGKDYDEFNALIGPGAAQTEQPKSATPSATAAAATDGGQGGTTYQMAQPNAPHYDFGGELPSVRPPKSALGGSKATGENAPQKPKNEPQQPEQGQQQTSTPQQEQTGEGAPLGPERFAKMMEMQAATQQRMQGFSQRMENIRKGNEPFGSHKGVLFNPTTGKMEDVYYTTSGDAVATPLEQSRINRENYKHTEMALEERTSNAMGKIDPDNVAEQVWQRAEERSRAEQGKHNRSIWDGMTMPSVMGGNTGFAKAGQTVYSNMVDHLKYHDIKRMADEAWQSLGSEKQNALINEMYSALLNRYPGAPDEELMPLAREMARQQSDKRMFELAVEKNAPKSATDYFFRNIYQSNAIMKIAEAAARKTAGTTGDWAARDVAENQYRENGHKFVGFLGTAAGMALDPVMWLSGGVSGAATRGTMWLGGKMFGEAATRKFATTIGGRALQGAVGGASNFATFESANEALEQMRMGGKVEGVGEDGQYIVGDYNVGDVFKQMGHGALMGSTIGTLGPLTGNVSDRLVGSIGSTAGKAGVRAGQLVVGKVAEGTIFSIPEWIEGERDAFDVWTDNMAMMLAFGIQGAVKSAPRRIAELSKQPGSKAGFETRLRSVLNGRGDLALTKDEREELQRGGYSDLNTLVEEYELYQNPGNRSAARPESEVRRLTAGDGAELPYNRFVELMNDSNISEAARAKMYYYITGQQLPMSTVMGSTIIEYTDENGNVTGYTVRSVGANGVITSRNFDSKERADVEVEAINRQAELNSVDIGERHYDSQSEQKRMMEACEAIGREKGAPAQSLYDMMQRNPDEMSEVELQWAQDIMKAYDELGSKYSSELLRAEIGSQFDVDVDKAIGKEPNRRSEAEQKAVEEYMNRLWEGVRPQEEEPTEAQRGYEANTDERKLIAAGVAMGEERGQEAWDGVRQRIEDDAEMHVAEWREEGKKAMHRDGSLRSATLKEKDEDGNDKTVYIVDGNVQMMADGTMVDPETSDRSVVIFDPATGKRRMIDPTSDMGILALGGVMSAEEFENDLQRRKQEYVQQQLDEASGKVTVQVGEQVQVPGTDAMGTVVAVSEDGEGITVELADGSQVPVVRGDLQRVADEQMMAEYEEQQAGNENENQNESGSQPNSAVSMVEGVPEAFTPGMVVETTDGKGNERRATVVDGKRYRWTRYGYVEDPEGVFLQVRESEDELPAMVRTDMVKRYAETPVSAPEAAVAGQPTGEAAMPLQGKEEEIPLDEIARHWNEISPDGVVPDITEPTDQQPTIEPMPMREDGEADFMATSPERGHQYIYNEAGLSREEAGQFVKANIEAADKELKKLQGKAPKMGTSLTKYQQEKAAHQQQVEQAQAVLDYWNGVRAEQQRVVAAERAEQAERDRAAHDAAVQAEQERQAEELAKQQEQAQRGANAVHPAIREKWENAKKVVGVRDRITLPNGKVLTGVHMLVEADALTPSHDGNNGFAPTEGFPVDENGGNVNTRDYERDEDAQTITRMISDDFDERGQGVVVSADSGITYSGNGRTIAGQMAARKGTDGKYINYLNEYGAKLGYSPEQVAEFEHPRDVFVPDEILPYTSETFDMFNAQEMKSQNKTEQAVKMGKTVDDATFGRIVSSINKFDTLGDFYNDPKAATEAIGELHRAGAVNAMQMAEMMDGEKISGQGRQMLENMLIGKAFEGNPDAIRQLAEFPAMRQSIVSALAEVANNIKLGEEYSLMEEMSQAINLAYQARKHGTNAGEKVSWFARQQNLFAFDEGETVADYTNATVLMLADTINDSRVSQLKKVLALYNDKAALSAAGQYDIFSGGVKSKEEIIKDVLDILNYGTETETQQALAVATERRKDAAGVQEDGTDATGGAGSGVERNREDNIQPPLSSDAEVEELLARMSDIAEVMPNTTLTPETWMQTFGINNSLSTPIGNVKMGENQYNKLVEKQRTNEFGMVVRTLQSPDVILVEASESVDGAVERSTSYVFVKTFIKEDGTKVVRYESVTVSQDGMEVSISSHRLRENQLREKLKRDGLLYKATALDAPANTSAEQPTNGGSLSSETDAETEPQQPNNAVSSGSSLSAGETSGISSTEPTGEPTVSRRKDTNNSETGQKNNASGLNPNYKPKSERELLEQDKAHLEKTNAALEEELASNDPMDVVNHKWDRDTLKRNKERLKEIDERLAKLDAIAAAEAEVNTDPTEGQKKAGNYKMGHVTVDGYDITIENPKGSVRRGTDPSGKAWEQEMHNTYGYIRGTEGVDGDHIDVFLSDDPTQGDVFVVDQVDPTTGMFDEHKVMYGFPDIETARQAYLSNYEEGWQGLGAITPVSKEEFKKWIESSHRKTKSFSDYKSIKTKGIPEFWRDKMTDDERALEEEGKAERGEEPLLKPNIDVERSRALKQALADAYAGGDRAAIQRAVDGIQAYLEEKGDFEGDYSEEIDDYEGNDPEKLAERYITHALHDRVLDDDEDQGYIKTGIRSNVEGEQGNYTITPTQYTTKKGKVLDMQLVKFNGELTKEQARAAGEIVKADKGWWSRADGGFLMRSEESAKNLAESIMKGGEAVADAQPLSLADMAQATDVKQMERDENQNENENEKQEQQPKSATGEGEGAGSSTADSSYGADNKFVSRDRYEELKERMRKKLLGQMNMGVDPEILAIGTEMAVFHIEAGARKFAEYAKKMIEDLGDAIRPYLKAFYNGVRDMPEMADHARELTSYDEVRAFDVENFDKQGAKDLIKTAETVTREQEVEKEAERATSSLKNDRNTERKEVEKEMKDRGMRRATAEDLEGNPMIYLPHKERGERIMLVTRQGEQIDAGTFSKPVISSVTLTDMNTYKLEDLWVKDERPARPPKGNKNGQTSLFGEEEPQPKGTVKKPSGKPQGTVELVASSLKEDQEQIKNGDTTFSVQQPRTVVDDETAQVRRMFSAAVADEMLWGLAHDSKPFRSIVDLRKRAESVGMKVDADGRDDILLQELVEDGLVRAARQVIESGQYGGSKSRQAYEAICKLYDLQPTIAQRSSNRIKMQQYSTPLPMAFVADMFAYRPGTRIGLEPTAGNGMLVFAVPANDMVVNELDETRLANLQRQGFLDVKNLDALTANFGGMYDFVIANPPFGSAEAKMYDGKSIAGLDPQIALNALSHMRADGRAAIIIGGNMEYADNGSVKDKKSFWTYLYNHYNVKGVVDMDGKLYAKQGTTYPTRLILIDGVRSKEEMAQSTVYPPTRENAVRKAESFEDLYDIVNEITKSKNKTNGKEILRTGSMPVVPDGDREAGRADSASPDRKPDANAGDGADGATRPADGGRGGRANRPAEQEPVSSTPQPSESGVRQSGAAGVAGAQTSDGGRPAGSGEPVRGERGGTAGRVDAGGVRGSGVAGGGVGLGAADRAADRNRSAVEPEKRGIGDEKLSYRPHNSAFSLQSVAPAAMVEAMDKTLSDIEKTYGESIDQFVTRELGYDSEEEMHRALAAEQVDSVAMAVHQMNQGYALIIGDQTGVGKGRQMAALIRWAVRQGKKPIFITQKADLFSDIYRDLVDVGSGDLRPFIFNSDGAIVDGNGAVVHKPLSSAEQAKVFAKGELPEGYDFAVLTYSQVNTGDKISRETKDADGKRLSRGKSANKDNRDKPAPKADFLRKIAKDNYLFLDESHTAAGESNIGAYIRSIIGSRADAVMNPDGGVKAVTFASATFAKRPDTMPMYALRTAMSQANVEPNKLISIIEKGGVTLQEIMSRALTESGQMVRRERDMSDVRTDWETVSDPATVQRARDNYDKTIIAFNAIIRFQEMYVKPMIDMLNGELADVMSTADIKRGTNKMGVENVPFASKTYNYTKQLMLALKADAIVDRVEQEIKAGRHPVIALESTMEASLKDYAIGEAIDEPTFSASLLRGLDNCMQYTVIDEDGNESHHRFKPSDLGPEGERAYYQLQELIRQATKDVFISPLDSIIEKLHERGYKVGELTGRNLYAERDSEGRVIVKRRTGRDKKRMQREFNSGALDVLILNKSASTGISLHASEKFTDQRQRSMIIAQPLSDINDYMQMIGRIDRTGQVSRGYYVNLGLPVPAESRFLMMLSTKLKSLNANTTTSQDSESSSVEAPDLLNKYGSQVVIEYLRDNPDIYSKMGDPLKLRDGGDSGKSLEELLEKAKPGSDDAIARKITGYVALLSTAEQEAFYNDVVQRYTDLIKYLDSTGTNDLKITVMPLRAKTLTRSVSSEGKDPNGSNPFAGNAYVEQVEMDVLRKPMKAEEVRKLIEQMNTPTGAEKGHLAAASKEKAAGERVMEIVGQVQRESEAKLAAEEERYAASKQKGEEEIAKWTEKINGQERTAAEKQEAIANKREEIENRVERRHNENVNIIKSKTTQMVQMLQQWQVGTTYILPADMSEADKPTVFKTPAIFCGYKVKKSGLTPSTSFGVFATLDGRRRIEVKFTDYNAVSSIDFLTQTNWDDTREVTLDNWDSKTPTETRKKGYIMTGNILQAVADTQTAMGTYLGQLISYSDEEGNIHDGILMPDQWKPELLRTSGTPIEGVMGKIRNYIPVESTDGKVRLYGSSNARRFFLEVPKSKKEGQQYYGNDVLLRSADSAGFYGYHGNMRADIPAANIDAVVKELGRLGVRVKNDNENENENGRRHRMVDDSELIARLDSEPKERGYRNVVLNADGTLGSPMASKLGKKGAGRTATSGFAFDSWEQADENPDMATEEGKIDLIKPDGKSVGGVDYNPYIHIRPTLVNKQFKQAWERPNLVYVETEYPASELTSGYKAEKAKKAVGRHDWNGGELILSRWDKPVRIVPWEQVADDWEKEFAGRGVEFDIIPPRLLPILAERGVEILPPHKGMGKACEEAYERWKADPQGYYGQPSTAVRREGDTETEGVSYGDWFDQGSVERIGAFRGDSRKRIDAMRARQEKSVRNRLDGIIEKMGLSDRVMFVESADDFPGRVSDEDRRSKGWYDIESGKIVIVLGNHSSSDDVVASIMHEGVGHYGMRELFGKEFDTFLDNVYASADENVRRSITELAASKYGYDFREATEEYIAGLAEDTDFENPERQSWWGKIKELFWEMLHKLGIAGQRLKDAIGDNELRYLLWRSWQNLVNPGRYRSLVDEAEDVAMQWKLKVGRYEEKYGELKRARKGRWYEESPRVAESGIEDVRDELLAAFKEASQGEAKGKRIPIGELTEEGRKYLEQLSGLTMKPRVSFVLNASDLRHIYNEHYGENEKDKGSNIPLTDEDIVSMVDVITQPDRIVYGETKRDGMKLFYFLKDSGNGTYNLAEVYTDKRGNLTAKTFYKTKKGSHQRANDILNSPKLSTSETDGASLNSSAKIPILFDTAKNNSQGGENERGGVDENGNRVPPKRYYRDGDDVPRAIARDSYESMMESCVNQFKEAVQDSMLGLKKAYEAILEAEGNGKVKIEDVRGYENAYLAENRMHSSSEAEINSWQKDYMEPLTKAIHTLAGSDREAYDELVDYMMAKHGLERNVVLAERDAQNAAAQGKDYDDELQKNREKDYAGLTALTGEQDVSAAEAAAQQMVQDYEDSHDPDAIDELWEKVNRATKSSLRKTAESGMMSSDRYQQVRDMFEYYIPLQGFDSKVAEEVYAYMGSDGTLGYGTPIRSAKGRKSKADDPIATISMNGEAAIRRGNRNLMKQHFLRFVEAHPSDLVSVSDVWLKKNDVTGEWEQYFDAGIQDGDSAAVIAQKVEAFEQRMEQLAASDPDHYKKGRDLPNMPYRVLKSGDMSQHQVAVMRGGKTVMLTFNGNPRAAQALNGLTNPDVFTEGIFGKAMNAGQWFNRQLSAFYTTRNPEFVLSNFLRDAIYSNSMAWVKESPNYALKFHKNFGRMNPVHMGRLFAQWEKGTLREKILNGQASQTEKHFYDFMMNGGETGWTNLRDIEKHKKALEKTLRREGNVSAKVWKALGGCFDLMNRSVENCARFAAYVTSREQGRSVERAVWDAKEVSVNFNKKGAGDKFLTAKGQKALGVVGAATGGLGRGLYVFFNASLQGLNNIARATKRHPWKASGLFGTLFTLGAVMPLLSALISGGDGDDDDDIDENAYYNLPEYIRRSNLCFRWRNDMPWITIPLPIEYRAVYGMGELATGMLTGNERYSDEEAGKQFVSQLSQVLPLDFMEGGGGWHAFVPSQLKPLVEANSNKSWTGLPIYRDNKFRPYDPQWTRAYSSANKQIVEATRWLNEATGGDDVTQGWIDWNPAKIEYMLKGYFGGYFTMYDRLQKSAETALGKRDFEWRNIPMASRVLKEGDERTEARKVTNEYFNLLDEYKQTKARLNGYTKIAEGGGEDALQYAERIDWLHRSKEYTHYLILDSFKPVLDAYYELGKEAEGEEKKRLKAAEDVLRKQCIDIIHAVDDGREVDVDAEIDKVLGALLDDEETEVAVQKKAQNAWKKHQKQQVKDSK